jgi:hypothetical protein
VQHTSMFNALFNTVRSDIVSKEILFIQTLFTNPRLSLMGLSDRV